MYSERGAEQTHNLEVINDLLESIDINDRLDRNCSGLASKTLYSKCLKQFCQVLLKNANIDMRQKHSHHKCLTGVFSTTTSQLNNTSTVNSLGYTTSAGSVPLTVFSATTEISQLSSGFIRPEYPLSVIK